MQEANHGSEVSPNQTIYINNLNEKVKLDGDLRFFLLLSSYYLLLLLGFELIEISLLFFFFLYRAEEIAECCVLSVRKDTGGIGV